MIHHMSFGVREPERVAHALAVLAGAHAIRAPSPPFPCGSWFVAAGDYRGSCLEILPSTAAFDPRSPLGLTSRPAASECGNGHVLISAVVPRDHILAVAEAEGWGFQEVETGLFRIVKLWIDDTVLVEVFAAGEAARYVDAFGAAGISTLEPKLRKMEQDLAAGLAERFSPDVLAQAFGSDRPD